MRHYYDSLSFPFLTDLLFDQLTNWDWANTRKEIEEAKKKEAEAGSVYSPEVFNKNIKLFSPTFELVDDPDNSLGKKYLYKTMVPKELKPEDIKIDATDGELYIAYKVKTKTGEREIDLKPLIHGYDIRENGDLDIILHAGSRDHVKPALLFERFFDSCGKEFVPMALKVHRTRISW